MPPDLFTSSGLAAIWKVTRGTPRLINQLCGRVLDKARLEGKARIGKREIIELADDSAYASLFGRKPADGRLRRLLPAAAAGMFLAAGLVAAGSFGQGWLRQAGVRAGIPAEEQVREIKVVIPARSTAMLPTPPLPVPEPFQVGPPSMDIPVVTPVFSIPEDNPGQAPPARPAELTYAMKTALKPAQKPGGDTVKRPMEGRVSGPRPGNLVPVVRTTPPPSAVPAPKGPQAPQASAASQPGSEAIVKATGSAPDIRLSAIAWDADPARRLVIMNDKILHEGESLGQTTVARIEADHVELVRDGESVVKRLRDEGGR
jgi:hypothetical protein